MERNRIYQGDCRELLKGLADCSVDCIVSDVAYRVTSRGTSGNMGGYWVEAKTKKGTIFDNNCISIEEFLPGLYKVLKERGHCYLMCNNKNITHFLAVIDASPFHFVKCLIWDKQSKICGTYYMGQYEFILLLRKGGHKAINDCSTPDLLSFPIPRNKAADARGLINPTQKPVGLFEVLIRNSTRPGELVLDPFMGSGTTAFAAANLGRDYIGFEIDGRQVEYATEALKQRALQMSLF